MVHGQGQQRATGWVVVLDAIEAAAVLNAWPGAAVPGLISAPGAAAWLGAAGWQALIAQAAAAAPGVSFQHALDCGSAPGHALAGLRAGLPILVLDGAHPAWPAVAGAAQAVGAVLLPARPAAMAIQGLDLRRPAGLARLRVLLAGPLTGAGP